MIADTASAGWSRVVPDDSWAPDSCRGAARRKGEPAAQVFAAVRPRGSERQRVRESRERRAGRAGGMSSGAAALYPSAGRGVVPVG